jgi:hypothetical protein
MAKEKKRRTTGEEKTYSFIGSVDTGGALAATKIMYAKKAAQVSKKNRTTSLM